MCQILEGYFVVNGFIPDKSNCETNLNNDINLECSVSFNSSEIGKSYRVEYTYEYSDIIEPIIVTSDYKIIDSVGTFYFASPIFTKKLGIYTTVQFIIYDINNNMICSGNGTSSTYCNKLTVIFDTYLCSITHGFFAINDVKQFDVFESCIAKGTTSDKINLYLDTFISTSILLRAEFRIKLPTGEIKSYFSEFVAGETLLQTFISPYLTGSDIMIGTYSFEWFRLLDLHDNIVCEGLGNDLGCKSLILSSSNCPILICNIDIGN